MDTSDFVGLGAGLALGGMMSRSIGNAFTEAMDAHSGMRVLTVPQTGAEIETLLDKLDVRLANGEISEAVYRTVTAKWQARLQKAQQSSP
jgi:hypothetical protein